MSENQFITLYVHIGSGKTGSTSIQKTLKSNSNFLSQNNTFYWGLMCEESPIRLYDWQIPYGWPELSKQDDAEVQLERLLIESIENLKDKGVHKIIWSNESIMENPELFINVLNKIKSNFIKVHIIGYLRRNDAWARSAYIQWGIKHKTYQGNIKPFKEWFTPEKVSFYQYIKIWAAQPWDGFSIRNFDALTDVTKDFIDYIGLKGSYLNIRDNDAPSDVALYLWGLYNNQSGPPILPEELYGLIQKTGALDSKIKAFDFESLFPGNEDLKRVRELTVDDRKSINQVLASCGQPQFNESELKDRTYSVTNSQIHLSLLNLLKKQQDEIEGIKKALKENNICLGKPDAATIVMGFITKFFNKNELVGWVWVDETKSPIVKVSYNGQVVGVAIPDIDKPESERKNNLVRKGFTLHLSKGFDLVKLFTDEFKATLDYGENILFVIENRIERSTVNGVQLPVGMVSKDNVSLVGKYGWLFLNGGSNNVRGLYKLDGNDIFKKWKNLISNRHELAKKHRFKFLQIFIPEKNSIYSDFLPYPSNSFTNYYQQLKLEFDSSSDTLFAENTITNDLMELFFKRTDSHLTVYGAESLFQYSMKKLGLTINFKILSTKVIEQSWDIGEKFQGFNLLEKTEIYEDILINSLKAKPELVNDEVPKNGGHVGMRKVWKYSDAIYNKKIVIFGNSFFWGGGTSLGQSWWYSRFFSEVHFIWSPSVNIEYLKLYDFDYVICQTTERFMSRIPEA